MAGAAYNRGWRNMADPLPTEPCHSNVSSSPDRPEPPSGIYIYICTRLQLVPPPLCRPVRENRAKHACLEILDKRAVAIGYISTWKRIWRWFRAKLYWRILENTDFIDNSKIFHDRDFRVYNKESDYVTIIKIPDNFEQQRDRGKLISSLRNMK